MVESHTHPGKKPERRVNGPDWLWRSQHDLDQVIYEAKLYQAG